MLVVGVNALDHLPSAVKGRTLAVGTSILYGSASANFPELQTLTQSLRNVAPIDRTTTFFIYRFPIDEETAESNNGESRTASIVP